MKREIINADYETRLVPLRELQSATGVEVCNGFAKIYRRYRALNHQKVV